jgi:hypothetical protein
MQKKWWKMSMFNNASLNILQIIKWDHTMTTHTHTRDSLYKK